MTPLATQRKFEIAALFIIVLSLVSLGGAHAATLKDGLVAYWKLDDNVAKPVDSVTGAANFSKLGTPTFKSAVKINGGYSCTSGNCLNTTNTTFGTNITSNASICLVSWINLSSTIASTQYTWLFNIHADTLYTMAVHSGATPASTLAVAENNGGYASTTDFTVPGRGSLNLYTFCIDRTANRSYVYENTTQLLNATIAAQSASGPFGLEMYSNGGVGGLSNGADFDEVGIWNRVLSLSEVTSLYNSTAGSQYPFGISAGVASSYFSMTAKNFYTGASISAFNSNVTINGTTTNYATTNGTINFNFTNGSININATSTAAGTYFPNTTANWNTSTPLEVLIKPYLYNTAKNVYTSNLIPIGGVTNFTAKWSVDLNGGSAAVNVTCNGESASPTWTGALSNNTLTFCPVVGNFLKYSITLAGSNYSTPTFYNLSLDFVLANFSMTVTDATSAALIPFNVSINGSTYSSSNGTLQTNFSRGAILNLSFSAWYYDNASYPSFNTSSTLALAMNRSAAPLVTGVAYAKSYTSISTSWTNPSSYLFKNVGVFLNGVNVANTSSTSYNFTGLTANTSYVVALVSYSPVGGVSAWTNATISTNTSYPLVFTYANVFNGTALAENASQFFEVGYTTPQGGNLFVQWFVNAYNVFEEYVSNGANSVYSFFTNYTASGSYNLSVNFTDSVNVSAVYAVTYTVNDTYPAPAAPYALLPASGEYEYEVPLFCGINSAPIKPYHFDFVYSVNGSAYAPLNIVTTDGLVVFDLALYAYGSNFSFGCRVNSVTGVSNYTYTSNLTRVNKNNFYLFTTGKGASYNALKPYTLGYVFEADNAINVSLYLGFVDCNGDGVWDYTFNYKDAGLTRAKETFACVNAKGKVQTTVGMTLFKNNSVSWDAMGCPGLSADANLCAVYKTYEVNVQ